MTFHLLKIRYMYVSVCKNLLIVINLYRSYSKDSIYNKVAKCKKNMIE